MAILPADAARTGLHDGTLSRVRVTGLPTWSLEVVTAYRNGFGRGEGTTVAEVLTRTGAKIAAELAR